MCLTSLLCVCVCVQQDTRPTHQSDALAGNYIPETVMLRRTRLELRWRRARVRFVSSPSGIRIEAVANECACVPTITHLCGAFKINNWRLIGRCGFGSYFGNGLMLIVFMYQMVLIDCVYGR